MTVKRIVVIPTYNEAENIRTIIAGVLGLTGGFGVLVMDDNSPDGTAGIVKDIVSGNGRVFLISRPSKLGLGSAGTSLNWTACWINVNSVSVRGT